MFVQSAEKLSIPCPAQSHKVALRPSNMNMQSLSTFVQRRSLNISHFNALHDAVSNLARIDDFDLEELGYGFFSDVFKATHQQTKQVLVLKRNKDTNTKMNILREIQLMNRLSHPNILKFKGVCVHEGKLHALTEFINGGDLDKFVTNKEIILTWKQRMNLALDIAQGMNYLHSIGIFHRDLSAKNCLVQVEECRGKKKYKCVVADLGLAEKIPTTPEDMARLSMVGTPYIMAPEVLHGKPYNETADVFSFGLIVCQLIARVSYDPEELPRGMDFGLAREAFQKIISAPYTDSNVDVDLPPPNSFLQLGYDCCQIDPSARPAFKETVSKLKDTIVRSTHVTPTTSFKVGGDIECHLSRVKCNSLADSRMNPKPPLIEPKRVRVNSTSKLTRSYSDISYELIQRVASAVSSAWTEENFSEEGEDDGFPNPFEELKHLNCNHLKLTDEPSLALLEMTFDLASTDSLKTPLLHRRHNSTRNRRPNSTHTDGKLNVGHEHIDHFHHQFNTHASSPVNHEPRTRELRSSMPGSRSPKVSCSEELVSRCGDCNLHRARQRAMILSPLGSHLASWWSSRHGDSKEGIEHQRQSLAKAMSIFSRRLFNLRRSISVPDFSQSSSLFHHVDAEAENRILHVLDISSDTVDCPSGSSDDLFTESRIQKNCLSTFSKDEMMDSNAVQKNSLESENLANLPSVVNNTLPNDASHLAYSRTLDLSLKSGELCRQQRGKNPSEATVSFNAGLELPSAFDHPECIATELSDIPKCVNRDSGYEESLSIPHSLPESSLDRSWNIPEEIVPVS